MSQFISAYRSGRRFDRPGTAAGALSAIGGQRGGLVWAELVSPDAEEFERVAGELGMGGLPYTELGRHRPRHAVEHVDGVLLVALKSFTRSTGEKTDLATTAMLLCIRDRAIMTVHGGGPDLLTGVRRRLEARPKYLACGPHAVLQAVCDDVVAGYDRIAHDIEGDIIELEHDVFDAHTPNAVDEIYALKREVLFFRRVEDPLHSVLSDLARGDVEVHRGTVDRFQHTLDRLDRVDDTVDALNELITNILQAHLSQVAVQQNADMRRISAWAAMIAVPTMIAGLYGMNFEHMPELGWTLGYPAVLVAMGLAVLVVYRRLRKSGWL